MMKFSTLRAAVRISSLVIACCFGLVRQAHAQCAYGTPGIVATVAAPTTIGQIITSPAMTSGQVYRVTGMVAGSTYRVYNCASGFDTQITIYPSGGGLQEGYNDDNGPECAGTAASINYVCPSTATKDIKLNLYNCVTSASTAGTVRVRLVSVAAFNPCPPTSTATCGVANAVTIASGTGVYNPPSSTCGFSTPGQEKIFSFTSTTAGIYTLSQASSFGYIDYFFKAQSGGCNGTGWTCIDDLNGAISANFTLAASTAYYILLDPEGSGGGSVNFTINCPAAPNPCSPTTALAACGTTQSVTLAGSGAGWNVTSCGFSTPGQERVYTYTPPTTGTYSLEVTSSTGAYIDYYWKLASGGCSATGWSCINDVVSTGVATSDVPMNWTAGVPVLLLLDAESTASVSHTFRLNCPPAAPACVGSPTAPANGATGIATTGTTLSWPTVAGATGYDVYFGTTNPAPTLVSSNQVAITYATGVLSGSTTYYWRIEPRNGVGPATGCTNWNFATAAGAPANDNCANAIAIASLPYTSAVINNALATDDFSTLSACDGPYKNVWWTVTGICGTMTAITCTGGTNFDNEIAIYTGSCGSFTQVTCNDDNGAGCTSNYAGASWTATAGTTYYITVGSYFSSTATGNLQLNVTATPFTASVAPTGISGTTAVCAGGSTTLTATGGTVGTGATIEWFTGSCGGTPAGTGSSISVSPGTATTYYVRYNGTCNTTTCASTVVSVTPLPSVSISPSTAAICPGGSVTLTATGAPDNTLAAVLNAINANSAGLIASIPTPSGFSMDLGVNATNISDGCSDMYDGGNYINTNLASAITYSDNTVTPSASFGAGGQYFTRYLGPGGCQTGPATLFFWAADINGLSTMSITGNNGADGQGTQDTHTFNVTANGITYTAFLKRVYNAFDPSINQLFLIPQPNSASQTIGVTTDDSQQNITGLTGVTRVYYMLYAGASGAFINNAQATTIAQNFVNIIPTSSYSWNPGGATTAAITVSPGSTTTYTVTYSSQGCSNTATREVTVNPLPTATASGGGTVCSSDPLPNVTFTFTGGAPYNFTYDPGAVSVTGHNSNTYTITNAPAGTYQVTAVSNGCTGTSFGSSATVTVNTAATANAGGPYVTCGQTAVNISATANGAGSWSGGLGSFANASNASTTYTPDPTEVGGSVTLTWTTDDPDGAGPCAAVGSNATLNVNICAWYSQSGGNMSDPIWSPFPVGTPGPATFTSTTAVFVQNGDAVVNTSANVVVDELTIDAGGTLTLNAATTLNTNGDVLVNGALTADDNSTLLMSSAVAQTATFASTTSFWDLAVDAAVSCTVTGNVDVRGSLDLLDGNFDCTGNQVSLTSSATQTGRLGPVAATASYTGNLRIERYRPAGLTNWMFMGSPIQSRTVNNWQDDFITAGYPGSQFPNFDNPVGSNILWPSIRWYDETNSGAGNNDGLQGVSSNLQPLTIGQGFAVWAGSGLVNTTAFLVDLQNNAPVIASTPITLPMSYTSTGNPTVDGWNLVSNPVPSPIDFESMSLGADVLESVTYYNPANGNTAVYDRVTNIGTNGGTRYIQSMQGFLLKATGAGLTTTVSESDKANTNSGGMFGLGGESPELIRLSIGSGLNDFRDEAVVHFLAGSAGLDDTDVLKYTLAHDDAPQLSTLIGGFEVAIDAHGPLDGALSIPLRVNAGITGTYSISADVMGGLVLNCLSLEDLETGSITSLAAGNAYSFTLAAETDPDVARFVLHINNGPVAAFSADNSVVTVGQQVQFTATSTTGNYAWSFGDGNQSTEQNPQHAYAAAGIYTVILTTDDGACSSSASGSVTVELSTSVAAASKAEHRAWATPQGIVVEHAFTGKAAVTVELLDATGRIAYAGRMNANRQVLPSAQLANGAWFVRLDNGAERVTLRVPLAR